MQEPVLHIKFQRVTSIFYNNYIELIFINGFSYLSKQNWILVVYLNIDC